MSITSTYPGCWYYTTRQTVSGLKPVPWLQMKGLWLEALGFTRGQRVNIRCGRRRLVITVIKD